MTGWSVDVYRWLVASTGSMVSLWQTFKERQLQTVLGTEPNAATVPKLRLLLEEQHLDPPTGACKMAA